MFCVHTCKEPSLDSGRTPSSQPHILKPKAVDPQSLPTNGSHLPPPDPPTQNSRLTSRGD